MYKVLLPNITLNIFSLKLCVLSYISSSKIIIITLKNIQCNYELYLYDLLPQFSPVSSVPRAPSAMQCIAVSTCLKYIINHI